MSLLEQAGLRTLRCLDPETAHGLALKALAAGLGPGGLFGAGGPVTSPRLATRLAGLALPNPVGIAAGFDKNAEVVRAALAAGPGFVEIGAVTPRPQPGNPRPRLFRLPAADALINRLGFNNAGLDGFLENLARARYRGVLGINIGRNFDTPNERAADDYCACLERVYERASYVAVNVSSPNTTGLRALQETQALDALLARLVSLRERLADRHGTRVPLALKVAPDLDAGQIRGIAAAVRRHRFDALIAINTTLTRAGVEGLPHASEQGGLSGAPIRSLATGVLAAFASELKGEVPLIGVGGILSGADAAEKRAAGAVLVQLYTGLIYRGPELIRECVSALREKSRTASTASR